jgi:hypothetical protein
MRAGTLQNTVLLIAAGLALLLLLRAFFFIPVRIEVTASRDIVNTSDTEPLRLVIRSVGRAGCPVPFRVNHCSCTATEGSELVQIGYSDDSTEVLLTPRGKAGHVVLRIRASGFPLPLLYEMAIGEPLADRAARRSAGHGMPQFATNHGTDP